MKKKNIADQLHRIDRSPRSESIHRANEANVQQGKKSSTSINSHEGSSWLTAIELYGAESDLHPFPVNYFQHVAVNAVRDAYDIGLNTPEERFGSVISKLSKTKMEYMMLLHQTMDFACSRLPMALAEISEWYEMLAQAVHDVVEAPYFAGTLAGFLRYLDGGCT
jgi:hypothetical protein